MAKLDTPSPLPAIAVVLKDMGDEASLLPTTLRLPALLLESEPRSHIGFGDNAPSCDLYCIVVESRDRRWCYIIFCYATIFYLLLYR